MCCSDSLNTCIHADIERTRLADQSMVGSRCSSYFVLSQCCYYRCPSFLWHTKTWEKWRCLSPLLRYWFNNIRRYIEHTDTVWLYKHESTWYVPVLVPVLETLRGQHTSILACWTVMLITVPWFRVTSHCIADWNATTAVQYKSDLIMVFHLSTWHGYQRFYRRRQTSTEKKEGRSP